VTQRKFNFTDPDDEPLRFERLADFFGRDNAENSPSVEHPPTESATTKQQKPKPAKLPANVYTVTQLTRLIKHTINDYLPAKITLTGEISNFKRHNTGHLYFTLKDENCQITTVMWRSSADKLKFTPTDGMAVVAVGRVNVYEPQGKYQLYVTRLEPAGTGALELAFRQMAEKLRNEGLFDPAHKKPIPKYPANIAIVTSPTGAAIRDISQTLTRRFPVVGQLLYPVAVQGDTAAAEIAAAIRDINSRKKQLPPIDLIIVGRGGGSIEDLWAFNEEIVARAVFDSTIPIISAVGHEIDTSIADMVADIRAATPTAAAELAVPVADDILQDMQQLQSRLYHSTKKHAELADAALSNLAGRTFFARPFDLVTNQRQLLDEKHAAISQSCQTLLHRASRKLETCAEFVRTIEPHRAVARVNTRLNERRHLLDIALLSRIQSSRNRFNACSAAMLAAVPIHRIRQQHTVLCQLDNRLALAQRQFARQTTQQLNTYRQRLENLDPHAVLKRGYSITRSKKTNKIITAETKITHNETIVTELAQNTTMESKVTEPPKQK